jgi:hypothetical protein
LSKKLETLVKNQENFEGAREKCQGLFAFRDKKRREARGLRSERNQIQEKN